VRHTLSPRSVLCQLLTVRLHVIKECS